MFRRRSTVSLVAATALAAAPYVATAAQAEAAPVRAAGNGLNLTIANGEGELWPCGFNPFNAADNFLSVGVVYEPLVFVDTLENAKPTPWLASSWRWSKNDRTLTFTIRNGVKWNDGQPFTAKDVVFTFQLLKKYHALDINSVWSVLSSVARSGNRVVLKLKNAAAPYFYYIADQVPIIPAHIWSSVGNPVTYKDPTPVGTGPFVVSKCTPQDATYQNNTKYWQPGLPKVTTLNYPALTSGTTTRTLLATGQAQWGGAYIPNVKAEYSSRSPDNHYWYPPYANVDVYINQDVPPLNDIAVRKAMAYAINRDTVSSLGESGYEPPANQSGIVTPTFNSWLDKGLLKKYNYSYNPSKATQLLEADGYKKNAHGIFAKDGKTLSFTLINVGPYSDWVASTSQIQQELNKVGIAVTVNNESSNAYYSQLYGGHYQLAYSEETGGPTPYYELRQLLYSANSAPVGKTATSDWERYSSPQTDKLINQYSATTSSALQHNIVNQLQKIMLTEVPVIPVTEAVDWYQYNTSQVVGWPTPHNPYALPSPYALPDWEVTLLHLRSK